MTDQLTPEKAMTREERKEAWKRYFESVDEYGEPTVDPPPYDPADLKDEEKPF
jgi:hypothetical protein